jgi:hypothetical protein
VETVEAKEMAEGLAVNHVAEVYKTPLLFGWYSTKWMAYYWDFDSSCGYQYHRLLYGLPLIHNH